MRTLMNILGTGVIFALFLLLACVLHVGCDMSLDRALLISVLAALAQVRWYQKDESPLGKTASNNGEKS